MAKRKRSTGHIFSEKTRKRNARIETAEYFEQEVLPKILDKDDVRNLTQPEIRGMQKFLKQRQETIKTRISLVEDDPELTWFSSTQKAKDEHLDTKSFSKNPQKLFQDLMRQEQFFNEYDTDYDFWMHEQELREQAEKLSQKNVDDAKEVLKINIDDKWTILRRLAAINPRLNVDRAYASRTLKDIENAIESGRWSDINEITANFIESFQHETEIDKQWDISLRSFEDVALSRSSGFHGVAKALRKATTSVDNFAPVWSSPFNVREDVELTHNMSTPF